MDTTPKKPDKRKPVYPRPPSGRTQAQSDQDDSEDLEPEAPEPEAEQEIMGVLSHINAERDGWMAGRLRTRNHGEVKFAGAVVGLKINDRAKLLGKFTNHPKWGKQFEAKAGSKDLPTDSEGFVALLMSDDRFKGIGPIRAQAILDECDARGMELEDMLADPGERASLGERAKVPAKVMEDLASVWAKSAEENKAKAKLLSLGISAAQANKLAMRHGVFAVVAKIQDDPYFLFREVEGYGFKKADAVAAKQGIKKTAKIRIAAGLLCAIEESLKDGHTWTLRSEVLKRAWKLLGLKSDEEKDKSRDALDEIEASNDNELGIAFLEIDDKRALGRAVVISHERDLLKRFTPRPSTIVWKAFVGDERLNEKQREAVLAAQAHSCVVITGPAGVGKTFLVGEILKRYEGQGLGTAVCAPTGKAAKRLEETFARQGTPRGASTIHRLLGYGYVKGVGAGFQFNSLNPLPVDIVVCDEASMLDVSLAWNLTNALRPTATLVLVGDHNQIPPVGAGAVLRDLVKTKLCPVAELTEVVRQAGVLRENSLRLLRGQLSPTANVDPETGVSPWVVADKFGRPSECVKAVVGLMAKRIDKYGADALLNTQVIAPQRSGPVGIETLNLELQKLVQQKLYGIEMEDVGNTKLLVGDKVMVTQNDYELDVMNGDQGIVVEETKENLIIAFGSGPTVREVSIPKKQTGGITLAYAITVHKCVHPDTLIESSYGLIPIRMLPETGKLGTAGGSREYENFVSNPSGPMFVVTTKDGYQVKVTPEHGLMTWTKDGYERVNADELMVGQFLRLRLGRECESEIQPELPTRPTSDVRARQYRLPTALDGDLAEFLGLMVADGTVFHRGFRLAKRHREVVDRFAHLAHRLFEVETKNITILGTPAVEVNSTELSSWLLAIGGLAPNKKAIPLCILQASRVQQAAFLRGLFEDGTVNVRAGVLDHIEWSNVNEELARTVQIMLLRFGVISSLRRKQNQWVLYVYGRNAHRFRDDIDMIAREKYDRLRYPCGEETRYLVPVSKDRFSCSTSIGQNARSRGTISRHSAELLGGFEAELGFHHDRIKSIEMIEAPSMCVTVPQDGRFLQNGFDGFNSQGSEWDFIIGVCHRTNSYMWHRNLLYTLVTRGAKGTCLIGDPNGARMAVRKVDAQARRTLLSRLAPPKT